MIPGMDILAIPLGWVLWFIYNLVSNYFIAIFLFTLIVRAATFPLSLKSQKAQADRAKLAPGWNGCRKNMPRIPRSCSKSDGPVRKGRYQHDRAAVCRWSSR